MRVKAQILLKNHVLSYLHWIYQSVSLAPLASKEATNLVLPKILIYSTTQV